MARSTRSRVALLTTSGRLRTLETVPRETWAAAATSLTDATIAHLRALRPGEGLALKRRKC